jgi:hypothetical protein
MNNWFNFFTPKNKRAEKLKDEDLIAFGRRDARSFNNYNPLAIKYGDLKKAFGGGGQFDCGDVKDCLDSGDICDIKLCPTEIELGNPVVFNNPGGEGRVDDTVVPGVLVIARDVAEPIFNTIYEASYVANAPTDTEWNTIYTDPKYNGFSDISNIKARVYSDFVSSLDGAVGQNIVGLEMVMHIISTDQYFKVQFSSWQGGASGGAFTYTRQEMVVLAFGEIEFSDGTKLGTAAPYVEDKNTALMAFTAFVNPNIGNDSTAEVGDANLPFATVTAAQNQSGYVYLTPGNYNETIYLRSSCTYYSPLGVKFIGGGLRCNTLISKTQWLGHADFYGNFFAIYLNGCELRDCTIEFNRITTFGSSSRSIFISAVGTTTSVDIKGVSVDAYGANAHGVRFQGTISGTCTITEFVRCYYSTLVFGFSGIPLIGKFVFNCPKIILRNGGFAGNLAQYKHCIYFIDSDPNTDVTVNGNCYSEMAFTMGSTSGAISTLSGAVAGGILKFNGNVYSQSLKAIRNIFAMTMVINGDINSDAQAFVLGVDSITIVKDSTILHFITNTVGSNAILYLYNSTLYCNQINANIFTINTVSGKVYFNNVQGQGEGVAEFINTNGNAPIGGLLNCSSNFVNDVAFVNELSTPLNIESNINVPKYN